ncbi:MAG TPA: hypothetical protein VFK18_05715 [Luteimonas sp.]|nr:hypothetical protein [Luteimonas sp.]
MPVNITIRGVPDPVAARLRERALGNRRSLQQELLALLEASALEGPASTPLRIAEPAPAADYEVSRPRKRRPATPAAEARLSLEQLWERARRLGPASAQESTSLIRRDRDARDRR